MHALPALPAPDCSAAPLVTACQKCVEADAAGVAVLQRAPDALQFHKQDSAAKGSGQANSGSGPTVVQGKHREEETYLFRKGRRNTRSFLPARKNARDSAWGHGKLRPEL